MKFHKIVTYAALTAVCLLLVIPSLIYGFPFLVGADSSYTVLSGSMSPALHPGDLLIVKRVNPSLIEVGDMITVESDLAVFTHRVVEKRLEKGNYKFKLKGDANEDPDPRFVDASQIIGRAVTVFPFRHLYTPYGFVSLVIAPTVLIIGKQMHRIYEFTKRRNRKELMRWKRRNRKSSVLETSTLLLALILVASTTRIMSPFIWVGSRSYFYDKEMSIGNLFSAGIWIIAAKVDIEPDMLNLKSEGEWVAVYAYIESEYDPDKIDVSTVMLDDTISAEWGEVQDGRLMVKFDKESVIDYLIEKGCKDGDEVTLTVTGRFLDGTCFEGSDTIKVIM